MAIPRFHRAFASNPLMLGTGLPSEAEEGFSNVAVGDMAPWYWLHDIDGIPGSGRLDAAQGSLFMGGRIDELTERVAANTSLDPQRVKFFWKYRMWKPGQLEQEIKQGRWELSAQDPDSALRPMRFFDF
mmetsp:Transcript_111180/g.196321  ORF Transcript_111180/g.196321 Transcript_111180/m.196321 type:complete len:129 (-) Transcript_111180:32-418(-)